MKLVQNVLAPSQYFREAFPKKNIVLHHTVSSTARSALTWWGMTAERIGTAYVIDKDGTVCQAFSPNFWAHHLGMKHPRNTELNRCSIGIEIANEGPLWKQEGGGFHWNDGRTIYRGEVVETPAWRGLKGYWAAYTPQQYAALDELLAILLGRFNLKPTYCDSLDLDLTAPDRFSIYSHRNVRRDKSDLSPAFDFSRLTCLKPLVTA
jgi:N-acetyl-anhydromuramyl-L-alanine amidase AmpD